MTTETLERVTLVTADGEAREARTYPDGSYACPFDGAAVISPDGWAEMQRFNAAQYAATGDDYTVEPYPRSMRLVWEMRGCPNPACLTLLSPVALATRRQYLADRDAEEARRKRQHERIMAGIAEANDKRAALLAELSAKAEAAGQCVACLRASDYAYGRARLVRHRDASNCPVARKYSR